MGVPGGDYIEMDTAGVLQRTAMLRDNGERLEQAWAAADAAALGEEAGVTRDELGAAFHSGYDPDSGRLRETANRIPPALLASAQAGEQCAYFYRAADANGRSAMPARPR